MLKHDFSCDLQVHPFGKRVKLLDILIQMEKNNLNLSALLDFSWHNNVDLDNVMDIESVRSFYEIKNLEKNVYCFENKKNHKEFFLVLGSEVAPEDFSWHVLSIGVREIKNRKDVFSIVDEIINRGGIAIIDHPFADTLPGSHFKDINEEKEKRLALICLKYVGKIALEWNGMLIPWIRGVLPGCTDYTNTKTGALSERAFIPMVTTTDLHIWSKISLSQIGRARINISSEKIDRKKIIKSLSHIILKKEFFVNRKYVSNLCFLEFAVYNLLGY